MQIADQLSASFGGINTWYRYMPKKTISDSVQLYWEMLLKGENWYYSAFTSVSAHF